MSVVLLRCSKCGHYSTNAKVEIVVDAMLDAKDGVFRSEDDIYMETGIPLKNFVEGECDECGGPVKLVMLDECPHEWQKLMRDTSCRICGRCGKVQQGRVVFDD